MSIRSIGAVAFAALLASCAGRRPEQTMSVTTAEGRLVPLDSVTTTYTVGGVRVIQRPNYANDAVAVNLYLLGGTRQLTPSTQGIELLLLRAGEYGTARYPGAAWRSAWGLTGSHLVIDTEADWTLYGFRGIRQEFDSSFIVFADRLMHPALTSSAVQLVRSRLVARLRILQDNPDGYVALLADSIAFVGHPYGLQPSGTEASLAALDSAPLARYVADQVVTSRLLLVVVGNVSRESVEAAVGRTLALLPQGSYAWSLPRGRPRATSDVVMVHRPLATNYILGLFQGPSASDPEYPAFRVAVAWLSSSIHTAVREERGLSYAAGAPYEERGVVTGGVYVSTNRPAVVLPLIKTQMDQIRRLPAGVFNLHYFTDQFIMDYFAQNMTNADQAVFLARAQLYRGDYRKAGQAMEDLRHVSTSDLRAAAYRYFRDIHFVYLGDTTRVERKAFTNF